MPEFFFCDTHLQISNLPERARMCNFDKARGIVHNLLTMTTIHEFLADARVQTETALDILVPAADIEPVRLHEAIRWSLFAGGKRLRPALVFAAGRTFGATDEQLVHTAAAVEMIHTYSLIHDDLPAMDNDDLRRGKPTCHKQFGEATAILSGDALQTLAFKSIAEDGRLADQVKVEVIATLARGAGSPAGMISGQQLDLDAEGRKLTIQEVEQIHSQKTGALIAAAARCGVIIGGGIDGELALVDAYARRLGLLFQMIDDILDVTQATERLGKTAGKDVSAEKATYPSLLGIDGTRALAAEVHSGALKALSSIGKDTDLLRRLANLILDRTR
jgi:geranylgeranyl diphosphate synthase type II